MSTCHKVFVLVWLKCFSDFYFIKNKKGKYYGFRNDW